MTNVFSKAKSNKTTTKKKVTDKVAVIPKFEDSVDMSSEKQMVDFHNKLARFAEIKGEMDKLKSELSGSESFIKDLGKEEFIKLFEKTGKRESSFNLTSEQGGNVMVIVQDKYITIDEERAEYLNETYGEYDEDENLIDTFVEENSEFKFNMAVLERNQEVIGNLIGNCEDISKEDKENLIECVTKYSIKKGTIEKLYKISNDRDIDIETLFNEIQPVIQLKSAKATKIVG